MAHALRRWQARRAAASPDEGVSDVVGSILLVAMTVIMATAFGVLMFQIEGPVDVPNSQVAVTLNAGTSGWGTGDETIRVMHNGGDPLVASQIRIVYSKNGVATTLTGDALGGAFCSPSCAADGRLTIGETWSPPALTMAATDDIVVAVATTQSTTNSLLAVANLVPGELPSGVSCAFDNAAPTVTSWLQSPANVASTTVGAITVTATLTDDCMGVDPAATPELWWRINPGTNPAFAQAAAMTPTVTNTWEGTVPSAVWATKVGQTVEYELRQMKDLGNHAGTSIRQQDLVELFVQYTYPSTFQDRTAKIQTGTVASFNNIQSGTDGSLLGTITDGTMTTLTTDAQSAAGTGWTAVTTDTDFSDDVYSTNPNNGPGVLRLAFPNPVAAGTITAVRVKLEQSNTAFSDDTWSVAASIVSGTCGTYAAAQPATLADSTLTFDLTALRPGGGSYTWGNINSFEACIQPNKVGSLDGTWRLDKVTVEVVFSSQQTAQQFDFTGVPAGAAGTRNLELSYSRTGDTYNVQVWSWATSTWTTRGSTLSSGSLTSWSYTLTAAEYSAGSGLVRIRFADVTPTSGTVGVLSLDYARVASS